MAHEIAFSINGKAKMAFVGETPWHGLGQQLTQGAPIETWVREAGMDFDIESSAVLFDAGSGPASVKGRKVLYRSDTQSPLGVVSDRYRIVQPIEVLEFFRDLTEDQGFHLETAGVMFDGAKYWALARTGDTASIMGKDRIDGYLLLATACDGSMQTTAQFTSVRVVCNNTLTAAIRGADRKDLAAIKVNHRSMFKPEEVKQQLGVGAHWKSFTESCRELAETPVTDAQALQFIVDVLGKPEKELEAQAEKIKDVAVPLQLFKGKGRGSNLKSAKGTAWGLVNSITEYVDHFAGADINNRLRLAWHYDNAYSKNYAFQEALNRFCPV